MCYACKRTKRYPHHMEGYPFCLSHHKEVETYMHLEMTKERMAETFPEHMKMVGDGRLVVHNMVGSLEKHAQTTNKGWFLTSGGQFASLRPCVECEGTLPIGIVVITPEMEVDLRTVEKTRTNIGDKFRFCAVFNSFIHTVPDGRPYQGTAIWEVFKLCAIDEKKYEQAKKNKEVATMCAAAEVNKYNHEQSKQGLCARPIISIMLKEIIAGFALNRFVNNIASYIAS